MTTNHIKNSLMGRWPAAHDNVAAFAPAKQRMDRVLDIPGELRSELQKITRDNNLTDLGKRDAMRKIAAEKFAPELALSKASIRAMRANLTAWRERLKPATPDKSDPAAIALRGELRGVLRAAARGERIKLLLAAGADPMMQAAALEAPNVLSGITDDVRGQLETTVIERTRPGELAKIEEAEEVIALLNACYQIAAQEVGTAVGYTHSALDTLIDHRAGRESRSAILLDDFVATAVGPEKGARIEQQAQQIFEKFGAAA